VAALSGFGATGPMAGRASYDVVAQATGGLLALTGFADGPPVRAGGALGDYIGGLYLALGVVAALLDRDRQGVARVLDLSNQDAIFAVTDSAATIFHGLGIEPQRVGNQHPFSAPYDVHPARDGYIAVATASNRLFRALCNAIDRPELIDDPRFLDHRARAANREEINGIVSEWIASRSCEEVLSLLGPEGADLPCARVASADELIDDPQLLARGMIERHRHPTQGEVLFHGNPLQLSGTAQRERKLAPELGADNAAVYAELGLGERDLERLAFDRII